MHAQANRATAQSPTLPDRQVTGDPLHGWIDWSVWVGETTLTPEQPSQYSIVYLGEMPRTRVLSGQYPRVYLGETLPGYVFAGQYFGVYERPTEQLAALVLEPPSERFDHAAESIEAVLSSLALAVPEDDWKSLPDDLTENPDHYIYGTPKR